MTAIAGWMITCMIFVFAALLGYAWLLWKKKKSCLKRKRSRKMSDADGKARIKKKEEFRSKVDDIFLVAFPISFLIFNVIYWPFCLRGHEDALEGWPKSGVISTLLNLISNLLRSRNEPIALGPLPKGLPLEPYTSQWTKNLAQADRDESKGCYSSRNLDGNIRNEYGLTTIFDHTFPENDYDFQCIFNTYVWYENCSSLINSL